MHAPLKRISKCGLMVLRKRIGGGRSNGRREAMGMGGLLLDDLGWLDILHKH